MSITIKKGVFVLMFFTIAAGSLGLGVQPAQAITTEELQSQIAAILAQIEQLQRQLAEAEGRPAPWCHDFSRNLRFDDNGSEVRALQTALQKQGFTIRINGHFDEPTASAVVGFQQRYQQEVLTPYGLQYGTGFVGTTTRAKLNSLYGCDVVQPIPTPVPKPTTPEPRPQPPTSNLPPVVDGIEGPSKLTVAEGGTWRVKAHDPEGTSLKYAVNWGDELVALDQRSAAPQAEAFRQTTTFTHSYSVAGVYYPTFTVTDSFGKQVRTSISVKVGERVLTIGSMRISVVSVHEARPLPNTAVSVYDNRGGYIDTKEANQRSVTFADLPAGFYTAFASAFGYEDGKAEFEMVGGEVRSLTIYLTKTKQPEAQPFIIISSPSGDATWEAGRSYDVRWTGWSPEKDRRQASFTLLSEKYIFALGIFSIGTIDNTVNKAVVTVPDGVKPGKYRLQLTMIEGATRVYNESNGYITVVEPTVQPSITVLSPNGGEQFIAGQTYDITWNATNVGDLLVSLCSSRATSCHNLTVASNGVSLRPIDPAVGTFSWYIDPDAAYGSFIPGNDFTIRVVEVGERTFSSRSNTFTIVSSPFDLNGNRVLDSGDADVLLEVVALLRTCPADKVCDVNGDGKVGTLDVSELKKMLQ